ncbi:KAP family P-loop NTPase fold protein [Leptospira bouyouniensis]|uniref:KAP family P-loop NTPase fold protein n=1 Tax=Leptospira bouyouniensis TaxID=2484911 RepID=UPI00109163FB|nr:P-loop NTPase fold protein [Leptospira bouyouniensis]TGM74335.1 hypothetical protein EHQ99_19130 [Leptospira bouyouniensis]
MKTKIKKFEINNNAPFEKDIFDRQKSIIILEELFKRITEPFVLSITSPWGTGKTSFLSMQKSHLDANGYNTIYFNAWENDFSKDPLISIVSEMEESINKLNIETSIKSETKELFYKSKKIAAKLIKSSIPLAVKLSTAGILDLSDFTEESISEFTEDLAKEEIKKYDDTKKSISSLKISLSELSAFLKNKTNKPLIIIIDELDRCRPNFTIELLETIKHLFSVNGIIFVLAIDKNQIINSIKKIYGENIDSDGYLRRFIDLEFNLPLPDRDKYVEYLYSQHNLEDFFTPYHERGIGNFEKRDFMDSIKKFSKATNVSLRKLEQIFIEISISLMMFKKDEYLILYLLILLIFIKNTDIEFYSKLKDKNISFKDIEKNLEKYKIKDDDEGNYRIEIFRVYLQMSTITQKELIDLVNINKNIININTDTEDRIAEATLFNKIVFDKEQQFRRLNILDFLLSKIDLSSNFSI